SGNLGTFNSLPANAKNHSIFRPVDPIKQKTPKMPKKGPCHEDNVLQSIIRAGRVGAGVRKRLPGLEPGDRHDPAVGPLPRASAPVLPAGGAVSAAEGIAQPRRRDAARRTAAAITM